MLTHWYRDTFYINQERLGSTRAEGGSEVGCSKCDGACGVLSTLSAFVELFQSVCLTDDIKPTLTVLLIDYFLYYLFFGGGGSLGVIGNQFTCYNL